MGTEKNKISMRRIALEKLKKENKVRSTGTGRAATWARLVPEEMMSAKMKQMTLFDILLDTDEDE